MNNKAYEFYAELKDFTPKIWRKFKVNKNITVADFSYIVLTLFEMQASHLFKVIVPTGEMLVEQLQKKEGKSFDFKAFKKEHPEVHKISYRYELLDHINHDFPSNHPHFFIRNVIKSKLSHAISMINERMQLWYDFGDDWFVDIRLEGILESEEYIQSPIVTGGEGFGIIEDCGGVWGLSDIQEAYKSMKSSQYRKYSEWLGFDNFDIRDFDIEEMNKRIQVIPPIYKRSYEEKKAPTQEEIDYIERRKI